MGRGRLIRRRHCCHFLALLILAGGISSGECDDNSSSSSSSSSKDGPTMLRRRLSPSVRAPLDKIATSDHGDTSTVTEQYLDHAGRILHVPCDTAECKKKRRRRRRRKKKEQQQNKKRRRRRKKVNGNKKQLADGGEILSKGFVSTKNDSSLPLGIDDNATSTVSDDADVNATLTTSDTGEDAVNRTTPSVPNAAEESTKAAPSSNSSPLQPPSMGGISAKPQHRCTASRDDTITEDHCAQPIDCLYDGETGLWNDDNCPDDQVCVYAKLCEAKLPTFPGGMPEGLQLAPAGGGGPGPGPLAASASSGGAAGRSPSLSALKLKGGGDDINTEDQQQQTETVVAADHLRRPHIVSLDLEDG